MEKEILQTALPIAFSVGGVYALFKWRLNKLEEVVDKMAQACNSNRSNCNGQINNTLEIMRKEFKELFGESLVDRKEMRKEINDMSKTLVRLDQKLINGHYKAGHENT